MIHLLNYTKKCFLLLLPIAIIWFSIPSLAHADTPCEFSGGEEHNADGATASSEYPGYEAGYVINYDGNTWMGLESADTYGWVEITKTLAITDRICGVDVIRYYPAGDMTVYAEIDGISTAETSLTENYTYNLSFGGCYSGDTVRIYVKRPSYPNPHLESAIPCIIHGVEEEEIPLSCSTVDNFHFTGDDPDPWPWHLLFPTPPSAIVF